MSSQNSSILYSPLEDDEIRLLVLVPGSGSKSIHCRLATVKLQTQAEVPVYEALSYMWGPPSPSTLIYVNDTPFEVRNNLFEALKQLPYEYFPRCLWVDAICINQKDNSERGHQVAIMSSVFRAATKVLVWLGGARDNSDMAFEALASVHGHLGMLHSIAKSWIMAGVDVTRYNSNQVETALLSICRRPYWSRVWIIQEILSASLIDVLCGSKVLGWEEFWIGLQCIANININISISPLNAAAACVSTPTYHIIQKSSHRLPSYTAEELFVLCSTCSSQCEDVRDRVYGLLSLCKDLKIVPDYTKSALELYLDVIQAHYHGCHSLSERNVPSCGAWQSFNCSFTETIKSLLGEPFWDRNGGKYLMPCISSSLYLSQKCKEMSVEIRMQGITRIREISPVVSTASPFWESFSYLPKESGTNLSIQLDLMRILSEVDIKEFHRTAAFCGMYFSKNPINTTFIRGKSVTGWGALNSDRKYRIFCARSFFLRNIGC